MSKKDLQAAIEQLQQELAGAETLDPARRERLQALTRQMQEAADEDSLPDEIREVVNSIRDSIEEFEVSHPRATGILNDIMVMLSNMGI